MELTKHWVVHGVAIDPLLVFAIISATALAGLFALIIIVWRNGRQRARESLLQQTEARLFEIEVAALKGRLQTMAEVAGASQAELGRAIHDLPTKGVGATPRRYRFRFPTAGRAASAGTRRGLAVRLPLRAVSHAAHAGRHRANGECLAAGRDRTVRDW